MKNPFEQNFDLNLSLPLIVVVVGVCSPLPHLSSLLLLTMNPIYRSSLRWGLLVPQQRVQILCVGRKSYSTTSAKLADSIEESKSSATNSIKKVPIQAEFKNPIVATLWAARQEAKQRLGLSDDSRGGGTSTTDVTKAAAKMLQASKLGDEASPSNAGKTPRESMTEISYPFSTDEILKETYQNPWGEMRFGKVSLHPVVLYYSVVIS
jgi:hypothetical protein